MPFSSPSDEEVGGIPAAIRAPRCSRRRSAAEADETLRDRADSLTGWFRRMRRRRRLPAKIAASGASHWTERAKRVEQSNRIAAPAVLRRKEGTCLFVPE